jgi:hypothetical protein
VLSMWALCVEFCGVQVGIFCAVSVGSLETVVAVPAAAARRGRFSGFGVFVWENAVFLCFLQENTGFFRLLGPWRGQNGPKWGG